MNDRVEIVETLGRYARAMESRDAEALAQLFVPDAKLEISSRYGNGDYVAGDSVGLDTIRAMFKAPAPAGRGMHYLTTDHLVSISGDDAHLQAQFLVIASTANERPEGGWPKGSAMMQGTLSPIMIGNYDTFLRKTEGRWLIIQHQVKHSLPMAPLNS
jgi:ketosteroid isomerase-like protein